MDMVVDIMLVPWLLCHQMNLESVKLGLLVGVSDSRVPLVRRRQLFMKRETHLDGMSYLGLLTLLLPPPSQLGTGLATPTENLPFYTLLA